MRFTTILAVMLTTSALCFSQVSQQWVSRYSYSTGTDKVNSMTIDASGNVYVTGPSITTGFGTEDYATVKYNSSGIQQWVKRYNGPAGGSDIANSIAVDASGNVYVTGESASSTGSMDYLTIKYNSLGDTLWTRRYNGSRNGEDIAYSIAIDASGNVYVTGSSEGTIGTHGIFEDYVTIKYNSGGVQQWVNSYNGPGGDFDAAYSIAVDGTGNVYVTGESGGGSGGSGMPYQDYATVKYNPAGVFQWVQRYNGAASGADDKANQLKLDASGNIYVTGKSEGIGSSHDYLTLKYNPAGTLLWTDRYNGTGNSEDEAASLDVDRAGNVYVTGISYTGSTFGNDMVTVKYNSTGVQQWVNSYNGPANSDDGGRSIQVDTSSNVYVTGYSAGSLTAHDFATVKYNSTGVIQWSIRYTNGDLSGSGDDPACIKVDNAGNVYVSGMSALDYATVKYSVTTGIEKKINNHPISFSLEQNYPNPFNPVTNIGFNLLSDGFVSLKVFDITGKLVSVPVSEYMNAGVHEISFNASQLSTGTYFYKLESGNSTDVKKMILIK